MFGLTGNLSRRLESTGWSRDGDCCHSSYCVERVRKKKRREEGKRRRVEDLYERRRISERQKGGRVREFTRQG